MGSTNPEIIQELVSASLERGHATNIEAKKRLMSGLICWVMVIMAAPSFVALSVHMAERSVLEITANLSDSSPKLIETTAGCHMH